MEPVIVVGDDPMSAQLRTALAHHNIRVLGAGLSAGLPLDMLMDACVPLDRPARAPQARQLTDEDKRRIAAADAKRSRRAAKRANGAKP